MRFVRLHFVLAALLFALPLVATGAAASAPLYFCCVPNNDLFGVLQAQHVACERFDTPAQAIQAAAEGAGVLILADHYPDTCTPMTAELFEQAAAKRLRLFVEFPAFVPGLDVGKAVPVAVGNYGAPVERVVVTSDFFGDSLAKMRIVMVQDCRYLPVKVEHAHLVSARVVGFDSAMSGLPKVTHPILFEASPGNVLVATTKLSQCISGRYAPYEGWRSIWQSILHWAQPDAPALELVWTLTVRPTYGKQVVLPNDAELQAVQRGLSYYDRSHLLVHPDWPTDRDQERIRPEWPRGDGTAGIAECYLSKRIEGDGTQAASRTLRADCNLESAMGLASGAWALQEPQYRSTSENLANYVYFRSGLCQGPRADPKHPAYGLLAWSNVSDTYWGDDNARAILSSLATSAMLDKRDWDVPSLRAILANFRTSGQHGFRPSNIPHGELQDRGWRHYYQLDQDNVCPHMASWLWCTYLWLYEQTHDASLLERAEAGIARTMRAYPNWGWEGNRRDPEICRMLLPLAWAVRAHDTPEHRKWLDQIATLVIDSMDESGAIPQVPNHVVTDNNRYGSDECPLTYQAGDPATDALYTINFAFIGMHEAAAATGEPRYARAADRMADFFVRTQTRSETHPELDGTWYRGFDFKKWEYWASNGDEGWGAWANEIGWTHSWITTTLALRLRQSSLWELTQKHSIAEQYPQERAAMIPSE